MQDQIKQLKSNIPLPTVSSSILVKELKFTINNFFLQYKQSNKILVQQVEILEQHLPILAFNIATSLETTSISTENKEAWLFFRARGLDFPLHEVTYPVSCEEEHKATILWELAQKSGLLIVKDDKLQFIHSLIQTYYCVIYCKSLKFNTTLFSIITMFSFNQDHKPSELQYIWKLWAEVDRSLLVNLSKILRNEESWPIRAEAAEALARTGKIEALPLLLVALKDREILVRSSVIDALSTLKHEGIFEPLVKLYEDDQDLLIRGRIIRALGELGDERAIPYILEASRNESKTTQIQAILALGKIKKNKKSVASLITALQSEDDITVSSAIFSLTDLYATEAVEALITLLKTSKELIRDQVIYALGYIGDVRAVEPLLLLLNNYRNKVAVLDALGDIGDVRAVELLVKMCDAEEVEIRYSAIISLRKIGSSKALPKLYWLYENDDSSYDSTNIKDIAFEAIRLIKDNSLDR